MAYQRTLTAAAMVAVCLAASAASAAPTWPNTLVGNTWLGVANGFALDLIVTTQTSGGKCQNISGTFNNNGSSQVDSMAGFYCPSSGEVTMTRAAQGQNVPYQVFTGNLNQANGGVLLISGVFREYAAASLLGRYSFYFKN